VTGIAKFLLVFLQWALVVLGLLALCLALTNHVFQMRMIASLPAPLPGQDTYYLAVYQNLVVGVAVGLCSMGLGAVLFYLRRLFLSRP
jgi:hypothetical protein